jgi:hypothetical protein
VASGCGIEVRFGLPFICVNARGGGNAQTENRRISCSSDMQISGKVVIGNPRTFRKFHILRLIRLTQPVIHECQFLPNSLDQQKSLGSKAIPVISGYKSALGLSTNRLLVFSLPDCS